MAELEKVINGLELCLKGDSNLCEISCPYYHQCGAFYENNEALLQDALAMLKAKEPKFVPDIAEAIIGCKPKVKVGHCPSCGVLMSETDRYCRKCGQAVKWE